MRVLEMEVKTDSEVPRWSAVGRIAEDPLNCATISKESGAVQQLILMALSDNEVVVEQACKTLCEPHCSFSFPFLPSQGRSGFLCLGGLCMAYQVSQGL